MSGFYLMHRGWQDNPVFGRDPFSRRDAFVWLIERAAFDDRRIDIGGKTVVLKRGQLCDSYRYMAQAWQWSLGAVQRFIARLETDTMVKTESDTGRLVITICNYGKYQAPSQKSDTPSDTSSDTRTIRERYEDKEGKELKDSEEPSGSSAQPAAPVADLRKIIFGECATWIAHETHQPVARAKAWLGKVAGAYGDGNLMDAIARIRAGPYQNDYIAAITAELKRKVGGNGRGSEARRGRADEQRDRLQRGLVAAALAGEVASDDAGSGFGGGGGAGLGGSRGGDGACRSQDDRDAVGGNPRNLRLAR